MCLQCITKATLIQADVLPGFNLTQATVHSDEWPLGWYGLVEMNDPTFVFPGPVLPDPTFGLSDAALDALDAMPAGYDEFCAAADVLGEKVFSDPMSGYRLVRACMEAGYQMTDGHLHYWLLHRIAVMLGLAEDPKDEVLTAVGYEVSRVSPSTTWRWSTASKHSSPFETPEDAQKDAWTHAVKRTRDILDMSEADWQSKSLTDQVALVKSTLTDSDS